MSLKFPISLVGNRAPKLPDIDNLELRLDASNANTLYRLTAGGSTAGSGGTIGRWEDLSSNANHCIQGDGGKRPQRIVGVINGLDAVLFKSSELDYLVSNSNISLNSTAAKTIFTVCKPNSGTGLSDGGSVWSYPQNSVTGTAGHITLEPAYRANNVTWIGSETVSTTSPSLITVAQSGAGNIHSVISMWLNGNSVTRTSGADGALADNANKYLLGRIGSQDNTNFLFDGYICEILVYDSELSTADRQAVEAYLSYKWGV